MNYFNRRFKILWLGTCAAFLFLALSPGLRAEESARLDEQKIMDSVSKLISVPPNWEMKLSNVRPAPVPGLYEAVLELRNGPNVRNQNIVVSSDSRYYALGNFYDASVDMDSERSKMMDLRGAPAKGPADAPVTIVEYSDFQCGSCKKAHETIQSEKLVESYKGKVRLVYKNFPLTEHKWATKAAIAALCAQGQKGSAFWKLADELFAKQAEITPENVREKALQAAKSAGLDAAKFQECYDKEATLARVQTDLAEGRSLGINMTPTFLVNGRAMIGFRGTQEIKLLIDDFLKKTAPR